jgi:hypothetical protein
MPKDQSSETDQVFSVDSRMIANVWGFLFGFYASSTKKIWSDATLRTLGRQIGVSVCRLGTLVVHTIGGRFSTI